MKPCTAISEVKSRQAGQTRFEPGYYFQTRLWILLFLPFFSCFFFLSSLLHALGAWPPLLPFVGGGADWPLWKVKSKSPCFYMQTVTLNISFYSGLQVSWWYTPPSSHWPSSITLSCANTRRLKSLILDWTCNSHNTNIWYGRTNPYTRSLLDA